MGSYVFDGVNDHLSRDAAPVGAAPLTVFVQFRPANVTSYGALASLVDKDSDSNYFYLENDGTTGGDPVFAYARNGGTGAAMTSSGFSAATWHHACAVFTSEDARAVFLDGGSKGANATNDVIPLGIDRITFGALRRFTPTSFFNGHLGWVFVWNVELSDAEVLELESGGTPPQEASLVAAYDLTQDWGAGPVEDLTGNGHDLTIDGATYDSGETPAISFDYGGGVTETPTPGGATAGGTGPTANATAAAGGSTAAGNAPVARVDLAAGGAVAGGAAPTASATAAVGGSTAAGNTPAALAGVSPGGAIASGTAPTDGGPVSETPTPGGSSAGGFQVTTTATVVIHGATAGGVPVTLALVPLTRGGATAGGQITDPLGPSITWPAGGVGRIAEPVTGRIAHPTVGRLRTPVGLLTP